MKKITLKCYRSERAETLLMQAANMIAARTKTRMLSIKTNTKSATINVAEPLIALAAADEIRRKTGVVVIVANLPTNVVRFIKFLNERGLFEKWCEGITKRSDVKRVAPWLRSTPISAWIICAFCWFTVDGRWFQADVAWHKYILENENNL